MEKLSPYKGIQRSCRTAVDRIQSLDLQFEPNRSYLSPPNSENGHWGYLSSSVREIERCLAEIILCKDVCKVYSVSELWMQRVKATIWRRGSWHPPLIFFAARNSDHSVEQTSSSPQAWSISVLQTEQKFCVNITDLHHPRRHRVEKLSNRKSSKKWYNKRVFAFDEMATSGTVPDRTALVLYGTETGTAQDIAEEATGILERLYFITDVTSFDNVSTVCLEE